MVVGVAAGKLEDELGLDAQPGHARVVDGAAELVAAGRARERRACLVEHPRKPRIALELGVEPARVLDRQILRRHHGRTARVAGAVTGGGALDEALGRGTVGPGGFGFHGSHYSFHGRYAAEMDSDDQVARIAHAWARERPDLDPAPLLIVGRIMRLAAAYDALLRPPFGAAGLGLGDFDLLAALRRAGSPCALTPSELADAMLVTTGAATKRIDRLERQGLVRRDASPTDGRSRTVTLTAAGRRLVDELIARHLANEDRLLEPLTPGQRHQLDRLLSVLAASVETAA